MPNLYVGLVEKAKQLPNAFRDFGSRTGERTDTTTGTSIVGWQVCSYYSRSEVNGRNWSEIERLCYVDADGSLWSINLHDAFEQFEEPERTSQVTVQQMDARYLRWLDMNGWADFNKIRRSIEKML